MNTTRAHQATVGNTTPILIADPRPVVRLGVRTLIASQPDLSILGEAGDCRTILSLLSARTVGLILLDPELPDIRGTELLKKLHEAHPDTPIIVFSCQKNSAYMLEAIRNGANGYLTKDAEPTHILESIRVVLGGEPYLDPRVATLIVNLLGNLRDDGRHREPLLTERERSVLNLLAHGKRNRDISEILFISEHTVKFHLTGLLQKLQASNRTDVVTKAINMGLISI